MSSPRPTEIRLRKSDRTLVVAFDDGASFELPAEYLRVYSPSAEVRGHAPGQETLQVGKEDVEIVGVEPVGSYAVALRFSDGHDTGIYNWELLYELGEQREMHWQRYLDQLAAAGHRRKTPDA
ncbi:MAG: DUF971 domain-containing protein [Gammaproteobacteria bacterium]|nr:DUF971 domain-containing protein [Gammaproteobacteria bacterium]